MKQSEHLVPGATFDRVRWARLLARENGIRWTAYAAVLGGLHAASRVLQGRMSRLERRHGLTGRTAVAVNYAYWQEWDWSRKGEEWTPSEAWKKALIEEVMLRYVQPGTTVLEIGPGAGRWTEALQSIAGRLIIVDLSDKCIELCRQRFAAASNIEYHVNDGKSLSFAPDESIDTVWTFDVFVHVAPPQVASYIAEIARVLKPGGRAVIHHASAGRDGEATDIGMRSSMTGAMFGEMAHTNGLRLLDQFSSWGPDGEFKLTTSWDTVSVVEKPA